MEDDECVLVLCGQRPRQANIPRQQQYHTRNSPGVIIISYFFVRIRKNFTRSCTVQQGVSGEAPGRARSFST